MPTVTLLPGGGRRPLTDYATLSGLAVPNASPECPTISIGFGQSLAARRRRSTPAGSSLRSARKMLDASDFTDSSRIVRDRARDLAREPAFHHDVGISQVAVFLQTPPIQVQTNRIDGHHALEVLLVKVERVAFKLQPKVAHDANELPLMLLGSGNQLDHGYQDRFLRTGRPLSRESGQATSEDQHNRDSHPVEKVHDSSTPPRSGRGAIRVALPLLHSPCRVSHPLTISGCCDASAGTAPLG